MKNPKVTDRLAASNLVPKPFRGHDFPPVAVQVRTDDSPFPPTMLYDTLYEIDSALSSIESTTDSLETALFGPKPAGQVIGGDRPQGVREFAQQISARAQVAAEQLAKLRAEL